MEVGRNDPCPCGSGKKYKKCCMKKDNLVSLQKIKEERLYAAKHELLEQLKDFVSGSCLSSREYYTLESEFKKRTQHTMDRGFFQFWLYFFHRFENGKRGIEYFLSEMGDQLTSAEKVMAERWAALRPQFLQTINETERSVVFEDYHTKQTYHVPKRTENLPVVLPWMSTIAFLEPIEDVYYFNGVRMLVSPEKYQESIDYVERVAEEQQIDREQVMWDYFPEILLSQKDLPKDKQETQEVVYYTYKFTIGKPEAMAESLYHDPDFAIEKWDDTHKKLSWVRGGSIYRDSEWPEDITLYKVDATIQLDGDVITCTTTKQEYYNKLLNKIKKVNHSFSLIDEQEEVSNVPKNIVLDQYLVQSAEEFPEYLSTYASFRIEFMLDQPLPQYDHQSVHQLVANGDTKLAETWLKHSEFELNRIVQQDYGQVEIKPDYNTARKELDFPLSPWVTGGENRQSSITPMAQVSVSEKDIYAYERLGFTPDTIDAFYVKDIVDFYQEKTSGKSKGTERKYRNSLYDIREIMEIKSLHSWTECEETFWKQLLTNDIYALFGGKQHVSKTQHQHLLTTVRAFVQWLSLQGKLHLQQDITTIIQEAERDRNA
ncbi:YecA family protein [Gracilibacillus phocaeensis]|uniref:YecA family protein n=1 Tax=Gracilibacillus phocaeensis TaxID=2042304 RepID=UPI00102F42EE|nr:SEC-C metal-binding domain-containing protein [Gracilibacillus phocaeensis]